MKGIITVEVEVDYGTILDPQNHGAIYMFTGAKTIQDMVKTHMDTIGDEIAEVLSKKPLVTYRLDGKLIEDVPQEVAVEGVLVEEDAMNEDHTVENSPVEYFDFVEEGEVQDAEFEEVAEEAVGHTMLDKLSEAIDYVSLELGIPQKIKVSQDMMDLMISQSTDDIGSVDKYKGFKLEIEGMEEPFIIVYKTYSGSDIKFYQQGE